MMEETQMTPEGLFQQAQNALILGDLGTASQAAEALGQMLPNHPDILFLQAVISHQADQPMQALALLAPLLRLAPDHLDARLLRLELALTQDDRATALLDLEQAMPILAHQQQWARLAPLLTLVPALLTDSTQENWRRVYGQAKALAATLIEQEFDDAAILEPVIDFWFHSEKYRDILHLTERLTNPNAAERCLLMRALSQLHCGTGSQAEINHLFDRWGAPLYRPRTPAPPFPPTPRPLRFGFCSSWLSEGSLQTDILFGMLGPMLEQGIEVSLYPLGPDRNLSASLPYPCPVVPLDGLSGAAAAARVRADGLHALFTLDIVAQGNHHDFYRHRPAPLVFCMMHPLASQGGSVDGLIMDPWFAPPGVDEDFCEPILRLPGSAVFLPPSPVAPPLAPPPCLSNGVVTFGSLNRPHKIDAATAQAWAEAMHQVPGSQLYLRSKYYDDRERERVTGLLSGAGISADRITIEGPTDLASFFASYDRIDIALDPLRFNGGITTVQALWQGVPVVTEPGDIVTSRLSASILAAIGRQDWIARDRAEWVRIVTRLAQDPPALCHWRQALRPLLASSNICDGHRMAADFIATVTPAIDALYGRIDAA